MGILTSLDYDIDSVSIYKSRNGDVTLSISGMIDTKDSNNTQGKPKPYSKINVDGIELELISYRQLSPTRWSLTYSTGRTESLFTATLDRTIIFATFHEVE